MPIAVRVAGAPALVHGVLDAAQYLPGAPAATTPRRVWDALNVVPAAGILGTRAVHLAKLPSHSRGEPAVQTRRAAPALPRANAPLAIS